MGEAASPDGKLIASIEVKLRGASSSNSTRISLNNANGGTLLKPGTVLTADGAIVDATKLLWLGPDHLRVLLCEATDYEVRSRLLHDPVTRADGSMNELEVEVRNLHYSDQQRRCV